jgi:hypothetical protein
MFESETIAQAKITIKKLSELTQLLNREIEGLSPKLYEFKPAPQEWSVKEIICHMRDVDEIFHDRCVRMVEDDEPFLRSFNPDELAEEKGYSRQLWEEIRQEWDTNRERNLELFKGLGPLQWLKGAFHQERGHFNVLDVASALVRQTEEHLEQIRSNLKIAH